MKNKILIIVLLILPALSWAGNPDRQGEAGAYELLLSPWARAAGLNLMNTATISGVEAMRLNPAGLHFDGKTEFNFGHMRLYQGAGISMNAGGLAFKIGENGTIGFSIAAMDFGDIDITTENQPGGTGGTYSPNFIQGGVGYSHSYKDKIFVGVLFRGVSETIIDVSAFGIAMDAGVQYRGGNDGQLRLGISVRNVGPAMTYRGEGLSQEVELTTPQTNSYFLTGYVRAAKYELPTMLNLGVSYDLKFVGGRDYLRLIGNFTSNAFSRDNIGLGAEYSFKNTVQLRASYKLPLGTVAEGLDDIYTGLSAGFSASFPTRKKMEGKPEPSRFAIDYAYRTTQHFQGTHNIGIRYNIF